MKSHNRHSRHSHIPASPQRPRKQNIIPENFAEGVVLFDNDEYYGLYLELLLGDFQRPTMAKVETKQDFESFKVKFTHGEYKQNVYVVDELFGWGEVDLLRLVQNLRIKDPQAFVIGCTALGSGDITNPTIYDAVAVKSKGNHEQSIAKVLSAHWGVELNYSGADPEKGYL